MNKCRVCRIIIISALYIIINSAHALPPGAGITPINPATRQPLANQATRPNMPLVAPISKPNPILRKSAPLLSAPTGVGNVPQQGQRRIFEPPPNPRINP